MLNQAVFELTAFRLYFFGIKTLIFGSV